MSKYLDTVREARKRGLEEAESLATKLEATTSFRLESPDARRLRDAGWKPKASFGGKVIWERPETGFYCSEASALHFLENTNIEGDYKA